jgi:hypothetical protein
MGNFNTLSCLLFAENVTSGSKNGAILQECSVVLQEFDVYFYFRAFLWVLPQAKTQYQK